ncbi:hypothetical protein MmiHf6_14480 [Methanimicrococcus hongohii]|uniref:Uncharacterized protein n=1 Tax=Methanimicrococcus hongohii TaxID=3028295 RepID=A0AA96V0L1_9EURY|nr:hypothetical protein [Methanimicrococcus sp. Hf6]WNY24119.1 hypothetical protein MmiHf6_14480 [Methanimicrococcus sp. Hf6]
MGNENAIKFAVVFTGIFLIAAALAAAGCINNESDKKDELSQNELAAIANSIISNNSKVLDVQKAGGHIVIQFESTISDEWGIIFAKEIEGEWKQTGSGTVKGACITTMGMRAVNESPVTVVTGKECDPRIASYKEVPIEEDVILPVEISGTVSERTFMDIHEIFIDEKTKLHFYDEDGNDITDEAENLEEMD